MATRIPQVSPAPLHSVEHFEDRAALYSRYSGERRLKQAGFVVMDLLAVLTSASVAVYLRFSAGRLGGQYSWAHPNKTLGEHVGVLLLYSGLIVLFCNTQRLYGGVLPRSPREEIWDIGKAVSLATILQLIAIYFSRLDLISCFVIMFTMLGSFLTMLAWRRLLRRHAHMSPGADSRNVVIVGHGQQAQALHDHFTEHPRPGWVFKGILQPFEEQPSGLQADTTLGSMANLRAIVRADFIDEMYVCHPDREVVKRIANEGRSCGLGVHIIPDLYDGLAWGAPVEFVGNFPTLYLPYRSKLSIELLVKRALDGVCSLVTLVVGAPLLLLIGVAIKLDSRGAVIYASDRIGRKGRTFRCYKFRTMTANAEALKGSLEHLNERDEVLFKIVNDPRITRVGRILRKYSLDELPQFWNVLQGEMSMVGPRPPLAHEVEQYELEHLRRLDVLPGITGLWQVESRKDPSFARYISLDVQYVERWHLLMDIKILLKTVAVVFAGSGQ